MKSGIKHKINWDKLLCTKRLRSKSNTTKDPTDERTQFDNDYSRIVFSSSFRRLQDKAQVFPLENSDFVRTRLTHSLEVATIAESIGVSIENFMINSKEITDFKQDKKGQLSKVLACVGLLHDIGNTPFGHFGEYAIQRYFKNLFDNKVKDIDDLIELSNDYEKVILNNLKNEFENLSNEQKNDFLYFDGNAQAFRTICCLQSLQSFGGLNLTCGTLSALVKYPRSSSEGNKLTKGKENYISYKKYGYLQSEKEIFNEIIEETGLLDENNNVMRNPIVYILEAADDISYSASDVEDGLKKGLLTINYLKKELLDVFYAKYKLEEDEIPLNKIISNNDLLIQDKTFNAIRKKGTIRELNLYIKLNSRERKIMSALFDDIEYGDKDDKNTRAQMLRVSIQGYMISSVVDEFIKNYVNIMNNHYEKELLNESEAGELREKLKKITIKKIFNYKEILKNELAGEKVVTKLLELFVNAILRIEDGAVVGKKSERLYGLISDNYKAIFENETERNLYNRLQLIVDFISGMTDYYALDLYKHLQGVII